ncbi:MAG TPA: glycosyltransferase family 4 protein, partial [Anaerolineales bacterium]|nr:glycosyltransferase family 4 protein [Anaerolineales bacterium]
YQIPAEKIDLGVQGIDTAFFRPVPAAGLRQKLGLEGCFVLLFVGFMNPRKGLEYLARAMQQLPANVHLVLAGRWAAGYRAQVWRAFGAAASRVHEVGFLPNEDLPAYYSMADLYVSPSLLEGLGVTPIEAMACGTPAVVTDATSGPEEVGDAGCVVPTRDADALAKAILHLVQHPNDLAALRARCRARVFQHFSYQRMTDLTLACYARFLDKDFHRNPETAPRENRSDPSL